jgi:hypothetical protein
MQHRSPWKEKLQRKGNQMYSLTQSDQSETELHLLSATTSIATLPEQERSKLNPNKTNNGRSETVQN